MGAASLFMPSTLGRRFLRDCASVFAEYVYDGARETTDQLVLYLVWSWYCRHAAGFRYGVLTRRFADSAYDDTSLIWHAKGARKRALPPSGLERVGPSPTAGPPAVATRSPGTSAAG